MRRRTKWIALTVALVLVSAVTLVFINLNANSYKIDGSLGGNRPGLPEFEAGGQRNVAAMRFPDGDTVHFVVGEFAVHLSGDIDLQQFLQKYDGEIVRGGDKVTSSRPAGGLGEDDPWVLVKVDSMKSPTDDLIGNLDAVGVKGVTAFSSEESARTVALYLREAQHSVSLNFTIEDHEVQEHPNAATSTGFDYIDASTFRWMTEDDDPSTTATDGLSIGVVNAWDYLKYKGVLQGSGLFYRPIVAIIDGGFNLEPNGSPGGGNLDYDNSRNPPRQIDLVDYDGSAGGDNFDPNSPWHGQGAFGAAAAYPRNQYGSAGAGGEFVRPLLIRIGGDAFTMIDAVRAAALAGADVISLSITWECGIPVHTFCTLPPDDQFDRMYQAVALASSGKTVVVASAGNDGVNIGGEEPIPCLTDGVVCVGGINEDGTNKFNFGEAVDIWAPGCVRSTVDPITAAGDPDNLGLDELKYFCGTSASAPFVAGIAGLMKAADPEISPARLLELLVSTANRSADSKVEGYTDAFRAVESVRRNEKPVLSSIRPEDGAVIGWRRHPSMSVSFQDPEVQANDIYRWNGEVTYESDKNGVLCSSKVPPYSCLSDPDELTLGTHTITTTARDYFGAESKVTSRVEVVNRPPVVTIGLPGNGAPLYSHIPTQINANVTDPDEEVSDAAVTWTSSLDGPLGSGTTLSQVTLSAGTHLIRVEATDGGGLATTAEISVVVLPGGNSPTPVIQQPVDGFAMPGQSLTFIGSATDPEDGNLPGTALEWISDQDGYLGSGSSITVVLSGPQRPCQPEFLRHQIRLVAVDSHGNEVTAQKQIAVGQVC